MSPSLPVILATGEPSHTPSTYMPDVRVEIAFDSNFATPAADRTWTDVTDYVELRDLIGIGFGRQDERSTADANDITLTLDNSDGRFTALRSASPYYPNVKIGRPIRVSATTVTGFTSIRFVGFIDGWPVEWDGTDAYAKATIRATSRLSRLGLTAKLKSTIEQEILDANPAVYYTLGDPSGATSASDSSGQGQPTASPAGSGTAVTFGSATGPGTDGLTAAQFAGGQYLEFHPTTTSNYAIRATIKLDALPSLSEGNVYIIEGIDSNLASRGVMVLTTGEVKITGLTGPNINDGATHDIVMIMKASIGFKLYVDGVLIGTTAPFGNISPSMATWRIGRGITGVISHVAVYDGGGSTDLLSAAQVADQWDAVSDGFAGERTDQRLLRLLDYVGVASTEVDTEVGVETMTYQLTSGQSVVDALRDVESTEGGVLFDGADGDVKFHNRSHRYLQTPAVTLDMESQHVGADYAPRLDRSTLVNDITVENPTTGEAARQVDTASSGEYGVATGSATSVADSYTPLQEKASWHIASYAEPRMRCPSLTVDVLAHVGLTPSTETLLGITVGDLLEVINAPAQSDTTSPTYFVEGYTETIGPESWFITFNLSPTYPTLNTFVLDSATRGLLDTGLLGY